LGYVFVHYIAAEKLKRHKKGDIQLRTPPLLLVQQAFKKKAWLASFN